MRRLLFGIVVVVSVVGLCLGLVHRTPQIVPLRAQPAVTPAAPPSAPHLHGWVEVGRETFDHVDLTHLPGWREDVPGEDGRGLPEDLLPFTDDGTFFHDQLPGFLPPKAYRLSAPLGGSFLTLEAYSRTQKPPQELVTVVDDPAAPGNHVLHLSSPEHTDGVILRTDALGTRYQICARVGFINFGVGDGTNGYQGGERNTPWLQDRGDATNENGCYFGAIYRVLPEPRNNLFAHHARIAFIDTDNNIEGWTTIWDPETRAFFRSGWHPVMMAVLDGRGKVRDANGPPVVAYAANGWNLPGQLYAVDAYKEDTWYTVCFSRVDDKITLKISGDFRFGGKTAYEAIVPESNQLFHFNDPHYWLLGDPHVNYYEGSMLVDDIILKQWSE